MKGKSYKLIILFVVLVICVCCNAQEKQNIIVSGRVVDYMAGPVDGAEVAVYEDKYRDGEEYAEMIVFGKTNKDGYVEFNINISSRQYSYLVVARKERLALAW